MMVVVVVVVVVRLRVNPLLPCVSGQGEEASFPGSGGKAGHGALGVTQQQAAEQSQGQLQEGGGQGLDDLTQGKNRETQTR